MNLSTHFTLDEFTFSQTAARLRVDNTPTPEVLEQLKKTALGLEMVRALIQAPIMISSGYRSPHVNRLVGGSKTSQHMTGNAVDITAPGYGSAEKLVRAIVASTIPYDQCILEFGRWCHISFTDKPRKQALVIDANGTRALA